MVSLLLQFDEFRRRNRFDFRNDVVGLLKFDNLAERLCIEHVDDMTSVGDLHRGRVRIAVNRDHFDSESLHFNRDFFSQFARSEQKHLDGAGSESGSKFDHDENSSCCSISVVYNRMNIRDSAFFSSGGMKKAEKKPSGKRKLRIFCKRRLKKSGNAYIFTGNA